MKWAVFKVFLRDCQLSGNGFYHLVWCVPLLSWLQERYRKALADSETVRRRTQKFVEDAKLFGKQSETELRLLWWPACLSIKCWSTAFLSPPVLPSFIVKFGVMFGLDFWCLGLLTIFSLCPAASHQVYLSDCFVIIFFYFIFFLMK